MPLKSQTGIGLAHSLSVVNHLYAGLSRIDNDDLNGRCSGIDGVLNKFFDDRRRTLDDLSRCNLIGNRIRKQFYYVAHTVFLFSFVSRFDHYLKRGGNK